jgi:phosphoribosylanthranilate isomerase
MLSVKICGLTTLDDALAAVSCGADLLGFNFYPPSPRAISPRTCASLVSGLRTSLSKSRKQVTTVGVFVNMPPGQVSAILDQCGLDLAQLSGDEPPADLEFLGDRAYKALRPSPTQPLADLWRVYPSRRAAPAYLVDASVSGQFGGTGETADWGQARALAERTSILLAGGLRPENVGAAVQAVRPWGVDVASGVESTPGRKDLERMRAFVQAARCSVMEES